MSEGAFVADHGSAAGLSVGTVAALLGVAPGTLRSWGRRYGLVPAGRSVGGHRRYTESDTRTLLRMQVLVNAGEAPAKAASIVRNTPEVMQTGNGAGPAVGTIDTIDTVDTVDTVDTIATLTALTAASGASGSGPPEPAIRRSHGPRGTGGGPGGRVLAVPGASAQVRGLARAAAKLDATAVATIIDHHLRGTGVLSTWDELLRPVLVAVGSAWARTGAGIDIEHVLSEAIMDGLRAHRSRQLRPAASGPVLLAGSAEEMHVLPLYVLGAALAECRMPTVLLGARVPTGALASAARRTRASGIFVWRGRASADPTDLGGCRHCGRDFGWWWEGRAGTKRRCRPTFTVHIPCRTRSLSCGSASVRKNLCKWPPVGNRSTTVLTGRSVIPDFIPSF